MTHKKIISNLRNILALSVAIWAIVIFGVTTANAAIYQITGTDQFVNGLPSGLTTKERAKLVTPTVTVTETSCKALKCQLVDKEKAKAKIKAIILAENPPPACPQFTTGTPPACVPIPCGQGFTGNQPNCTPIVVPPQSFMPAVDVTKNMTPAIGYNTLRISPTTEKPSPNQGAAFRIICDASHMNNDDALVFPNQQGAAHHHTYFGNTGADYRSTTESLMTSGNSTCNGGIMNRSAYWIPSLIDTATNAPIKPLRIQVYYKTGQPAKVTAPPKGLRMIAGNMKSKVPQAEGLVRFTCNEDYNTRKLHIPACTSGQMEALLNFPNCWDNKNLDSPDHQSHMAYSVGGVCPATHPVMIPDITFIAYYAVTKPNGTADWRLSSDNYQGGNGGYSFHGDWMSAWTGTFLEDIVKNCLKGNVDAHAHLLCDGRQFH